LALFTGAAATASAFFGLDAALALLGFFAEASGATLPVFAALTLAAFDLLPAILPVDEGLDVFEVTFLPEPVLLPGLVLRERCDFLVTTCVLSIASPGSPCCAVLC
jgi:hypothetical protein